MMSALARPTPRRGERPGPERRFLSLRTGGLRWGGRRLHRRRRASGSAGPSPPGSRLETAATQPRQTLPAALIITIRCRRSSRFARRTVPPHAEHLRRTNHRPRTRFANVPTCGARLFRCRRSTYSAARGPAASAASLAAASSRASISWLFSPSRRIATVWSTCSRAPTTSSTGTFERLCSRTL